jgi:subtilisin-like proprotein convertase family protein
VFEKSSSPVLPIPDNNAAGVTDTITCPETGRLSAVEVSVNIRHTYRGDLIVSLVSPSGKIAVLHERNGGPNNDLQRSFTPADTAALSTLLGDGIEGRWSLQVQDMASVDTGTLESWSIKLTSSAAREIAARRDAAIEIPDNAPAGIEDSLTIDEEGLIDDIEVDVDITHSFIGDLRVTLSSPAGMAITLHNRSGGRADNIIRTYTTNDTPALTNLTGQSFQGEWTLEVMDLANFDRGKLNGWGVRIRIGG